MKKVLVLIPVIAILAFWMTISVMAAPATRTPVSGSFTGSLTVPGKVWITEGGTMHIKDGEGAGPVTGDLPGYMVFTTTDAINLKTGCGSSHGKWVFSDDYGTFEGSWRVDHWDVIYFMGTAVAQGTGAYEGMLYKVDSFWGYNWYLGGYQGPDGVHFDFLGTILSTKG